jgi:hypothetical protein
VNLTPLPIRLHRAGIVYPNWTRRAAGLAGIGLDFLCAILMLETAGGVNEFGHDPTICIGWGEVTQAKVAAYLKLRDATGLLQGVGPMQATNRAEQDACTAAGGLWLPVHTIAVGAHMLAYLLKAHGGDVQAAATAYNGSGPAAEEYGRRAVALTAHFHAVLGV